MENALKEIKSWYKFIRKRVGFLDIYDIGILKVSVLSIGMIIGSFYSKTVRKFAALFAFVGAIGSVYLFIKIFLKDTVL